MGLFRCITACVFLFGSVQLLWAASVEDKYEPMVAFICGRPAMHRGVNNWLSDKDKEQNCPDRLEDVLNYCKTVYPDHNITNVVEASYLVDIDNWPMGTADRSHSHHVRPFRCLVGNFQSDALLVPQHCEFDHRHDISTCEVFSHWNVVADENCAAKGMHLESLGMLLNCNIGKFNGVEYVCCPNQTKTRVHEPQTDDTPDQWDHSSASEEDEDEDETDSTEEEDSEEEDSQETAVHDPAEDQIDLYEAYLRGQEFPLKYDNEHKRYLAAKDSRKKDDKKKFTKLLLDWQKSRERVNEVRKTDPRTADKMNKEIAERFQRVYATYEQEAAAEKEQLSALHQQHIQAGLNERKRTAMDKYITALENGDLIKIAKYLRSYIKAEEKDRMHTVNHFEHIKYSSPREAFRIHPHIINHLKLSERRIDQAMEMLTRFPKLEAQIRPEIEEFMKRFNAIATSIQNVVIPVPKVEDDDSYEVTDSQQEESNADSRDNDISIDDEVIENNNVNVDELGDDIMEDEHDYERRPKYVAHAMADKPQVHQGLDSHPTASTGVGSTIGIALGSVSVFVIIVVAIIMIRHRNPRPNVSHGYVEVDPSASPEERHLTNMQMNGYENPTYKYFEVQNNPKA